MPFTVRGIEISRDVILVSVGLAFTLSAYVSIRKLLPCVPSELKRPLKFFFVVLSVWAIGYEAFLVVLMKGYSNYLTPVISLVMALFGVVLWTSIRMSAGLAIAFDKLNQSLDEKVKERTQMVESQQKELMESARLASVGQLAGGVAHEINNPLAIISGNISRLKKYLRKNERSPDLDVINILDSIQNATVRISNITKNLSYFANENPELVPGTCSLQEIVDRAFAFCEAKISNKGIQIRNKMVPESALVDGHLPQLTGVLLTLLLNAADAAEVLPEKWISIDCRENGDSWELAVTDSGSGLSAQVRSKIFGPFYSTKKFGESIGLSLSAARGIIHSHGGTLTVDESSKNTCFKISLRKPSRVAFKQAA